MESLITAGLSDIRWVWAAYALTALFAYGCCWLLFATMTRSPEWQSVWLWPFWVLLFSVSPISLDNSAVAPTLVITLFALERGDQSLLELTTLWWIVGALSATLYFLMLLILRELWRRFRRSSKQGRKTKQA